MKSLTMAWRNVWRNSRRTLAAVAATSLGLWAMIVYSGMATGYLDRMERQILDVELGDIQASGGSLDPSSIPPRCSRRGSRAASRAW